MEQPRKRANDDVWLLHTNTCTDSLAYTHVPTFVYTCEYIPRKHKHAQKKFHYYVGYGNDKKKIVNEFVLKYPSGKRN